MSNTVKTALLLGVLGAALIFVGGAIGGEQGMIIGFLFAVVDQLRVVLVFGQDRPADVQRGGGRTRPSPVRDRRAAGAARGLPQPRCYVIPDASPNAFATGRNPQHAAVAATEGLLQTLNDDELAGVLAHELAHVKHRDILISSVAATLAAAIMMISRFAMFFGGSRDDDRQGCQSDRAHRDDDPGPDRRDADSGHDLALARVRRRRRRSVDCRRPTRPCQALKKIDARSQSDPAGRQSGHSAHVHHQAVQRPGIARTIQHTPAHGKADPSPAREGLTKRRADFGASPSDNVELPQSCGHRVPAT